MCDLQVREAIQHRSRMGSFMGLTFLILHAMISTTLARSCLRGKSVHAWRPHLNFLQGVWNHMDGFTLTDPVIHHSSSSKTYGKTDKGKQGIREFFATHKCTPTCRLLGLSLRLD